ncbi:hypothetical protein QBC37DRAFT_292391 [Rhypophila decipiens]|uniref:DUF1996 domain-containing protein n=1 Tax=Rhypophila decipiens TaxID=261697 RepID=A0AAN7B2N1_9PEZI|nr:hypothetical protein QBC37DRAFT_292391 [Rhypophila decipiens]
MGWKSSVAAASAALLAQNASAQSMLRFGCSQLVIERSDPLVNPGINPSSHTHQIVGGNSFNFSMDPATMDPAKASTCTSCTYSEDFSNYWTASMFFRSPENGTYRLVPQFANWRRLGSDEKLPQDGGLTVYYMPPFGGSSKVTAFKPGFRMIAGDPTLRAKQGTYPGICHRCQGNGDGFAPCDSRDTSEFPLKMCPGGIRATVIFPSCWDGINLDSPDHRSHMAYAAGGAALAGGACPASHPVRVPQVMYEIMWDTRPFNDAKYFEGGKQPFVYSFGDATGHGQHGDYLFGWKDDSLQRGMDELGKNGCYDDNCSSALKIQDGKDAIACTKASQVEESVGRNGECKWSKR